MNEEAMRKRYERTPKETLINILIASREEVEKLQNRNKGCKQETERLNNIINEFEKTLLEWHEYWEDDDSYSWQYKNAYDYLQGLKGSDK